jgi:hypothetical protein
LEELERKQIDGLCAPSKDVVHDIVESRLGLASELGSVTDRVCNDGRVVARQPEVLHGKLVHDGVNLNNRRVDAMCHQSGRGGTYA